MIRLRGVYFKYRTGPPVLENFNEEIPPGINIILGPNGSGKTTLLKLAAGILKPARGEVEIYGKKPEELRGEIAYIPQIGGLYPWMTNRDNIALPLKIRKTPQREVDSAVEEAAHILDIAHLLRRYPREVSGGERQKILIARAIASGARLWLMDEPLSMVDIDHRADIINVLRKGGWDVVIVTHNVQDVVDLGGRVYVVKGPPLRVAAKYDPGSFKDAHSLAAEVQRIYRQ
ncbi:MAG: ATP-binding cassette domain-containing protein [Pyrobaculum sp.]